MTQRSPGLAHGKLDGGDQLVVGQRRRIEAGEELGRRDAPLARGAARNDRRHRAPRSMPAARRRDRRRPASRRWCRGCGWRDGRSAARPPPAAAHAGAPVRCAPSSAWVVSAPTRMPSPVGADAAQLGHARDVDQRGGLRQAEGEGGEKGLSAGQQPGIGAGRRATARRRRQASRPDIGERRRFHAGSSLDVVDGSSVAAVSGSLWPAVAGFKGGARKRCTGGIAAGRGKGRARALTPRATALA